MAAPLASGAASTTAQMCHWLSVYTGRRYERRMPQQRLLCLAALIKRRVGQCDEAHGVIEQPRVVGSRSQRCVQHRIARQVDLAVPAARQRHLLGDVLRFPVVASERNLDATEWLLGSR